MTFLKFESSPEKKPRRKKLEHIKSTNDFNSLLDFIAKNPDEATESQLIKEIPRQEIGNILKNLFTFDKRLRLDMVFLDNIIVRDLGISFASMSELINGRLCLSEKYFTRIYFYLKKNFGIHKADEFKNSLVACHAKIYKEKYNLALENAFKHGK